MTGRRKQYETRAPQGQECCGVVSAEMKIDNSNLTPFHAQSLAGVAVYYTACNLEEKERHQYLRKLGPELRHHPFNEKVSKLHTLQTLLRRRY